MGSFDYKFGISDISLLALTNHAIAGFDKLETGVIFSRNSGHLEKSGIHSNEEVWDERREDATAI
jgi:hypothetical protein